MASGKKIFEISAHIIGHAGLDINVCPVPVKTDVGQADLVLRLSDGTSEKIRTNPVKIIYFHRYKILGLLYNRALFDLQFVHNLF